MRLGAHNISLLGLLLAAVPPVLAGAAILYLQVNHQCLVQAYQPVVAPLAGLVSAVAAIMAAVVVASFNAGVSTRNAKVKAAFDTLAKKQWDKDYLNARETYLKQVSRNAAFSKFAYGVDKDDKQLFEEFEAVMNIANDYEMMAVAIENDVLDEHLIKMSYRTAWIEDHKVLSLFIRCVREQAGNERYFIVFETVARRWLAEKQREDRRQAKRSPNRPKALTVDEAVVHERANKLLMDLENDDAERVLKYAIRLNTGRST